MVIREFGRGSRGGARLRRSSDTVERQLADPQCAELCQSPGETPPMLRECV